MSEDLLRDAFAVVSRIALVAVVAGSAWIFADRSEKQERVAERRAFDLRAMELTARALAPASPLGCLDAGAGEAVEGACENALFANPQSVAAAVIYTDARLSLLADGLDYARRADSGYENKLAGLRRAIEADRYGLVAHVLATRDGCTVEQCGGFAWLRDAAVVKANLNAHTYEKNVERYAAGWSEQKVVPPVVAAPALPLPGIAAAPTASSGPKINFPTAASIPPVSIMNDPPAPPASPVAAEAVPQPRRPPAAPTPPRKPATAAAAPSQPATNAAAPPAQ